MPHHPIPFHFVDVFAVEPLTGNPLVVVEGGEGLPPDLLGRIAREFNQSETTFVQRPTQAGADARLRSFTPGGVEVFGAGHNALGAWWWLAEAGRLPLAEGANRFVQEIGDLLLPLEIAVAGGRPQDIAMDQAAPVFGRKLEEGAALAAALGLPRDALATERLPAQVVWTGAPHLLVPLADREAVDRIRVDSSALLALLQAAEGEGCYVFSLDPRQPGATAYARFFNPTVGIAEDPATGTAAGPLAAQLVAHGLAKAGESLVIEQGTAIGRTSLLRVTVMAHAVRLSGRAITVASGTLRL